MSNYASLERYIPLVEFMGKIWRRQGGLSKMYQNRERIEKMAYFPLFVDLEGGKCL